VRLKLEDGDTDALLQRAAGFWRERGRTVRVTPKMAETSVPGGLQARYTTAKKGREVTRVHAFRIARRRKHGATHT
jgi:hypothetical protein